MTPLQVYAMRQILKLSQAGKSDVELNESTRVKNYKFNKKQYRMNKIMGEDTRNPWGALGKASAGFSLIEMYIGMILEEEHNKKEEK